ncbi:MAG: hypothetical protein NVSMB6_12890 [Burkholderiaceae bacterium]
MRTFLLYALVGASVLGPLPVSGQDSPSVTVNESKYQISLPDQYIKMWPENFADFIQGYDLLNGMTLQIFSKGTQMDAALDDGTRHKIVATAPNKFFALDKKIAMTIDLHQSSQPSGQVYIAVPAQRLSNGTFTEGKTVVASFQ